MKKIIVALIIIITLFVLLMLKGSKEQQNYLVKINNYTITPQEFNEEFLASAYSKENTPESRREFLNTLIRRKLVLQDAQSRGLDKDKEFLKSIERFWEQSLLKLVMDQKAKEISSSTVVPDAAVEAVYNELKKEGKANKPYDQMYSQLKWSLTQIREAQALNRWLASLYKAADIKVNPVFISKKSGKQIQAGGASKELKSSVDTKETKANTKKK